MVQFRLKPVPIWNDGTPSGGLAGWSTVSATLCLFFYPTTHAVSMTSPIQLHWVLVMWLLRIILRDNSKTHAYSKLILGMHKIVTLSIVHPELMSSCCKLWNSYPMPGPLYKSALTLREMLMLIHWKPQWNSIWTQLCQVPACQNATGFLTSLFLRVFRAASEHESFF